MYQNASASWKVFLTLSLIRQFCSRWLWTCFVNKWKISIIEWLTYDKKWKTLWQKEKLNVLWNFFFCHYIFKKLSAAAASESVYMRERVKIVNLIYRELLKNEPIFKIPEVIDELTTSQVLTTEYVEGLPVDQCVELDQESRDLVSWLTLSLFTCWSVCRVGSGV